MPEKIGANHTVNKVVITNDTTKKELQRKRKKYEAINKGSSPLFRYVNLSL